MAKDWEKNIASAEAWLLIAHIRRAWPKLRSIQSAKFRSRPPSCSIIHA
jgi:hypothetical protein